MGRVVSILAGLFAVVAVLGRAGATDRFDRAARRVAERRMPRPVDGAIRASAWPGFPPQSRLIPPAIAAATGAALGPRAALWQLAAWGVVPAATLAKHVVRRQRPAPARIGLTGRRLHGSSLPSDHVATYVSVYGCAWWLAAGRDSRLAWLGAVTALPLIVLVGPSRVRMDEHWATDTLAGYLFGAAYLGAIVALARRDATLRRERSGPSRGLPAELVSGGGSARGTIVAAPPTDRATGGRGTAPPSGGDHPRLALDDLAYGDRPRSPGLDARMARRAADAAV